MKMPRQRPHRSKQDYSTPDPFVDATLHRLGIQAFSFDFAADATNAKAKHWWGVEHDSLKQSPDTWVAAAATGWGWLNPPFGQIDAFAGKCWQMKCIGGRIAFLVPAGVGANWFKRYVHGKAFVLFLNGRLAFIPGKPRELYPKDCVLCLYAPDIAPGYAVWTWKRQMQKRKAA